MTLQYLPLPLDPVQAIPAASLTLTLTLYSAVYTLLANTAPAAVIPSLEPRYYIKTELVWIYTRSSTLHIDYIKLLGITNCEMSDMFEW